MNPKLSLLLLPAAALGLAACGGNHTAAATPPIHAVTVDAGDYSFSPSTLSAAAGKVTITLKNTGKVNHELVVLKTSQPAGGLKVSGGRVSEKTSVGEVSETAAGATKSSTLTLEPGRYVFVCNVPGHYKMGMRGTLTVT